jgi:hypothetical protein
MTYNGHLRLIPHEALPICRHGPLAFCELDRQILFRTCFYFDRPTKFAPEQIVAIEVARPLPHGADLTAVFNFIGQRVSNARVNLRVQN